MLGSGFTLKIAVGSRVSFGMIFNANFLLIRGLILDYMNGFQCNITGSTSNVPLAKSQVARRCGADPENGKMQDAPGNCTFGAKQPFYWFQKERNNVSVAHHLLCLEANMM